MNPLDKLMSNVMEKTEHDSWKRQEHVSYEIFRDVRSRAGRSYCLKLEKVQQSNEIPSGISEEDAKSIGHRVYRTTRIRERIK